jgi:hypothetical protein
MIGSSKKDKRQAGLFKQPPVPLPVKRKAEFWTDVFMQTLGDLVTQRYGEDTPDKNISDEGYASVVTNQARLIADAAIREYEDRWPGVLIS